MPSAGQRVSATVEGVTFTICYAQTPIQDGSARDDMREANARLIAAAPDLYAACVWAEAALAPFSKDPAEKSGISMLRAALSKAKGA